tara:strand:+ start:1298 stop:1528 length:231 start_codon:yes stop_codon:yes gene_type:complete
MKKLIFVIGIIGLFGCNKKTQPCKTCPQFSHIYYDTVVISTPHFNYKGMCFPEGEIVVIEKEEILIENLNQNKDYE